MFCLLLVSITALTVDAQTWADTAQKLDAILSRYQSAEPGCQLAISRYGKVLYSTARGMADLEHNTPLTTTSLIEAGSVSKQFTAAAILLLEQQGKLSQEEEVRKYIPELPDYGHPITIQHLLHHTSGLRDWGTIMELAGWPRGQRNYTNAHALLIIAKQKELNNIPGDEFIYSNSNFTLLTIIVERVSGKSLQAFTSENIFVPAGMTHTRWRTNPRTIVPNRAIAYTKTGGVNEITMPNESVYGHAGLLTTAEDLLAWNNYYFNGKLGSASILNKQLATRPLNNGQPNYYAAGLFVDSMWGWKRVSHSGATAGYRADITCYPDLGLSFAWISNTSAYDRDTFRIPQAVTRLFVKPMAPEEEKLVKPPIKTHNIPDANKPLSDFAGVYYSPEAEAAFTITEKNGMLQLVQQPAIDFRLISKRQTDHFTCPFGTVQFERDGNNKVTGFRVSLDRARRVAFVKQSN